MTVTGGTATFSENNTEVTVTITNQVIPPETEKPAQTPAPTPNNAGTPATPSAPATAVQTGDETPIAMYLGLMLAALAAFGMAEADRRRRRRTK